MCTRRGARFQTGRKSGFFFRVYAGMAGSGDLAQLARASALQAEGQGFKSPNLHERRSLKAEGREDMKRVLPRVPQA